MSFLRKTSVKFGSSEEPLSTTKSWGMAPSIGYALAPRIIPASWCSDFLERLISTLGDHSLFINLSAMSGLASRWTLRGEISPAPMGVENPSRQEAGD